MSTKSNTEKQHGNWIPEELNPHGFQSVIEVFQKACGDFADLPAFTSVGRTLSYRELNEKSDNFAAYLQNETDLTPGDRIAVQLPNVIQYPVVVFGAIKAGLVIVNTNPLYTPKELQHQFADAGVKAVVVFANMAHNVEKVLPHVPSLKEVIITEIADFHPQPKRLLINSVVKYVKKMVPAYHLPMAKTLNQVLDQGSNYKAFIVPKTLSDLAVLQYTGGTTGVAKGAILTHANLIANMNQLAIRLGSRCLPREELFIAPLPMYHVYAFLIHGLTLLQLGAHTVLIPNPRDILGFVKELSKWPFTGFIGLNTLFVALCKNSDFVKLDFSTLKTTASGGMPLTHAAAEEWEKVTNNKIVEGYGLTETSPVVAFNPFGAEQIGTIGIPVPETQVKFIDDEGNEVIQGDAGMLCVHGPQVMQGYWNNETATQEVMTADNYLITGDIGLQQKDGYIKIVDRAKDMVVVSGFNVYPAEVEDCLCSHPDILEAAVIGVADESCGELVKAFVVLYDTNKMFDVDEVRQFCRKELAAYKVPKHIEIRAELPKTNVGKVLRRALREENLH